MGTLLDRYGIDDPAANAVVGTYPGELQQAYDSWLAEGSSSLDDAYAVGVALEERDIADLKAQLAEVDNADIERVLSNLLRGSENHLAAFTSAADGTTPVCEGTGPRGPGLGQAAQR